MSSSPVETVMPNCPVERPDFQRERTMSSSPLETVNPDCPVMPNCPVKRPNFPECIGVFWDVVDFPFPEGLSPHMIYHTTRLFLHSLGCCGDMLIIAYVDMEQFDDKLVGVYEDAGIDIVPRLADKHTRYRSTSLDIAMWEVDMCDYDFHAKTLMVLSKEIEKESLFSTFLESMATPCHHVFVTIDHDPPPNSWLEQIRFDLLLDHIDQSETSLSSSDCKRKREEESIYNYSHETMPSCPIIPDSTAESTSEKCSTHVFWDGVDFPLPYNDAYMVLQTSLQAHGLPGELSLAAYVHHADFCGVTETDRITIIPCQGDEEARFHAILVDIVLWAMENPATYFEPKTLMVISKNIKQGTDFLNALEALDSRHYNVILGMPDPEDLSSPMTIKSLDMDCAQLYLARRSRRPERVVSGFSNGLASLDCEGFCDSIAKAETMIFWDVHGCPADFSIVKQVLHNKGYDGSVIIRPYVPYQHEDASLDKKKFGRFKSIIRVRSQGDAKYAKVTRMLLDIVFWAMNNDGMPQNLMLISKPCEDTTKCDAVIQALERRGINIIFRPSDQVASVDQSTISRFESLCKSPPVGAEKLINQSRILTDLSRELAWNDVVVFWLADNCPTNSGKIWYNIKSALEKKGYRSIISTFTVYIDKRKYSDEMRDVFNKAGVHDKIISEEDRLGKVTTMLLDMICWRRGLWRPPNFLVISEPFTDPICDMVVEGLKLRGCNVLFELPDYMLTFGRSRWSAKSLLHASCTAPS
ncbi:unnamed protein product [Microthlaspi erraticum]|uniref:NYN domain-containing protein n=1 Tax=Microthlaspi erraticum TaxID=1685480 RepID=A0A6D2KN78_9BRAS|nr:unnamed protein product [Microthlaspi erraticum]